jgi:hypothetical protein
LCPKLSDPLTLEISVLMSADLRTITVDFGAVTDRGQMAFQDTNCSRILDLELISKLGGTRCSLSFHPILTFEIVGEHFVFFFFKP